MGILRQLTRKIRGPRCHLDSDEKAWVERRLLWLNAQFGSEPIRRAPLDPDSQLLPSQWDGSYEAGADLLERLCNHMLVESSRLELQYYSEAEPIEPIAGFYEAHRSGPAGLFIHPEQRDRLIIALDAAGLDRPAVLAATICHELAHVHLLADRRITHDTEDSEPLTDLLTVYFGAGILTANSAFQFSQWQDGGMQGWSASALGYLSEALFGYSLACFCWYRGNLEAGWRRHLRENIAYYFDESMHFLSTTRKTGIPFDGA